MGKRKVALWLGIALAIMLALCGLGLAALAWVSRALDVGGQWTVEHKVPAPFHATTSAKTFHFRSSGFQDPYYELIFEVSDADDFVRANGLVRGAEVTPGDFSPLDAKGPPARCVELEGFTNDELYRQGQLWEWPGHTYVYLVAFGT